jgi:hypothetical protein
MQQIVFHGGGRVTAFPVELLTRETTPEIGIFRGPSAGRHDAEIQNCVACGRAIAPVAQLDAFSASTGIPRNQLNVCVDCRSAGVSAPFAHDTDDPAGGWLARFPGGPNPTHRCLRSEDSTSSPVVNSIIGATVNAISRWSLGDPSNPRW